MRDTPSLFIPLNISAIAPLHANKKALPMPLRLKKLIGSLLILILAILYALIATAIATAQLGDAGGLVHLIYFGVTGMFWIVPAMFIIKWMHKVPNQH